MRISDWSSDVCSSDLTIMKLRTMIWAILTTTTLAMPAFASVYTNADGQRVECHDEQVVTKKGDHPIAAPVLGAEIGRASCRERACQYVSPPAVAVSITKQPTPPHTPPPTPPPP